MSTEKHVRAIQQLLSSLYLRRPWTTKELVAAQTGLYELRAALMSSQEMLLQNHMEEINSMMNRKPDTRELWDLELKRIGIM